VRAVYQAVQFRPLWLQRPFLILQMAGLPRDLGPTLLDLACLHVTRVVGCSPYSIVSMLGV
jgi:hypothetical protein